ncbi:MAG: NAD(P)/FAD-dependent oxidoreductase [Candidatus Omnitrophica bacterium]|nr:NAD(P)/FAD-dependent oxidoreductase [Candidatus Omnitrophota bacterium]
MLDKYDVVIIGSGIGGLISGCYLAKSGMKVLIVEKNKSAGGCCASFKRRGFKFDAGVHVLTAFGKNGILRKIFEEFNLDHNKLIRRIDPSDIIITPDFEISFYNDINKTVSFLKDKFPKESKGINDFFNFLKKANFSLIYAHCKNLKFSDVLNLYFKDFRLKSIMTCFLGEMSLPSYEVSALSALLLYQKYILDGGYYPVDGTGNFTQLFVDKFKNYGGTIFLSHLAYKIKVKNGKSVGVKVRNSEKEFSVRCKFIISDIDARYTFLNLLGKDNNPNTKFVKSLKRMIPSPSCLMVYLGITNKSKKYLRKCCSLWYLADYKIDNFYSKIFNGKSNFISNKILCTFQSLLERSLAPVNNDMITLIIPAPFKNCNFWKKNKLYFAQRMIDIAKRIIPNLDDNIVVKDIATPQTFYRYTFNYRGAMRGWAKIHSQVDMQRISPVTPLDNLFIVSHWTTYPGLGGVAGVSYLGRYIARLILKRLRKR